MYKRIEKNSIGLHGALCRDLWADITNADGIAASRRYVYMSGFRKDLLNMIVRRRERSAPPSGNSSGKRFGTPPTFDDFSFLGYCVEGRPIPPLESREQGSK